MKSAVMFSGLLALVAASPVKRQSTITDADILNYALTLEHLEDTFCKFLDQLPSLSIDTRT